MLSAPASQVTPSRSRSITDKAAAIVFVICLITNCALATWSIAEWNARADETEVIDFSVVLLILPLPRIDKQLGLLVSIIKPLASSWIEMVNPHHVESRSKMSRYLKLLESKHSASHHSSSHIFVETEFGLLLLCEQEQMGAGR